MVLCMLHPPELGQPFHPHRLFNQHEHYLTENGPGHACMDIHTLWAHLRAASSGAGP